MPGQDQLIPLDDYQGWFGRRTQRSRAPTCWCCAIRRPIRLRLMAVESKWYKSDIGKGFVQDEFGPKAKCEPPSPPPQSLRPGQERLDKDYWQKMLASLLDAAPSSWDHSARLRQAAWRLEVDGIVYVHQYQNQDTAVLRAYNDVLHDQANGLITFPADSAYFALGPNARRMRMKSHDEESSTCLSVRRKHARTRLQSPVRSIPNGDRPNATDLHQSPNSSCVSLNSTSRNTSKPSTPIDRRSARASLRHS